jgi:hypothetical protein
MVPTHDEEHEVSPEEEKMPSEAAELSVHGKYTCILTSPFINASR